MLQAERVWWEGWGRGRLVGERGNELSVYHNEVTYHKHGKSISSNAVTGFLLERSRKTRLIVFFLKII